MRTIAVLLNGTIQNDYRVIKIIQTLSENLKVHLYYVNGNPNIDKSMFNKNVLLYSFSHKSTFWIKAKQHTLFCYEFLFFYNEVIKSKVQYDIIWCNDLPTLVPAVKIATKIKCKLIFDSHEIYIETLNQFFPRKSNWIKKLLFSFLLLLMKQHGRYIETKNFTKVDVFITVNESILSYFNSRYSIKKGIVLMNLPRLKANNSISKINFNAKFSWEENSFISIYQGILNEGRGLKILLEAFNYLDEYYKLIILGNGPIQAELFNYVVVNRLEHRIKFLNLVPLNIVHSYTCGADLGINLLEDYNLSKSLASPNKLFEYIQAEIPVIASLSIENRKILDNYSIGLLTLNDPIKVAESIKKVSLEDKSIYSEPLIQAKKYFNWENQEKIFNQILNFI